MSGHELDLGPGSVPVFSPDGTRAAFIAGDDAVNTGGHLHIVELEDGSTSELAATGNAVIWQDARLLSVRHPDGTWNSVDVDTGRTQPTDSPTPPPAPGPDPANGAYELRELERVGTPLQRGGNSRKRFEAVFRDGSSTIFEAYWAVPYSPSTVVIATEPQPDTLATNLFLVNLETGEAMFLVSTYASSPNWPLTAGNGRLLWTERYCALVDEETNLLEPAGDVMFFDVSSDTLTRIEFPAALSRSPWEGVYASLSGDDAFQVGTFGVRARGSFESMTLTVVFPTEVFDWTDDWTFAATGQTPGHGGLC